MTVSWREDDDPLRMLAGLGPRLGEQLARRFACACCRRVEEALPEWEGGNAPSWQDLLLLAEQVAEGNSELAHMQRLRDRLVRRAQREFLGDADYRGDAWRAVRAAAWTFAEGPVSPRGQAWEACEYARDAAAAYAGIRAWDDARRAESRAQADLLRCLAGPVAEGQGQVVPQNHPPLGPWVLAWEGGRVGQLATSLGRARDWAALPVLADALEEAGCVDEVLLAHLRGPGPHARGCWALEHVLGRRHA